MLVLSRRKNESVVIGDDITITITILEISGDKVRLFVSAPRWVPVHRREVFDAIRRNSAASADDLRRTGTSVLSRKKNESVVIGDDITIIITIVEIRGDKVRLGIDAPKWAAVHRREDSDAIRRNSAASADDSRRSGEIQQLDLAKITCGSHWSDEIWQLATKLNRVNEKHRRRREAIDRKDTAKRRPKEFREHLSDLEPAGVTLAETNTIAFRAAHAIWRAPLNKHLKRRGHLIEPDQMVRADRDLDLTPTAAAATPLNQPQRGNRRLRFVPDGLAVVAFVGALSLWGILTGSFDISRIIVALGVLLITLITVELLRVLLE